MPEETRSKKRRGGGEEEGEKRRRKEGTNPTSHRRIPSDDRILDETIVLEL